MFPVIRFPCSADFSPGRGGFLQLLGMTLPPCCPYQPRRSVSPHQSLATIHAAFARKVRARPSGCSTLEAIWVHLRYGPVARLPSLRDGFVNRLQDYQFPSFLLFKLRGSGLLPRWDSHPLFMPAFAGRTLIGTYFRGRHLPRIYHPKHYLSRLAGDSGLLSCKLSKRHRLLRRPQPHA